MVTIYYASQPGANSLKAAYRPVIIQANTVFSPSTPISPVVYCDIYFNGVYYKTLSKTQYSLLSDETAGWTFDLQDAAQEYLKKYLGSNGGAALMDAAPIILKAYCRVRATQKDANGFVISEGSAPVQATGSTPAVSGQGLPSDSFYILNATLQHDDVQDLPAHLNAFKRREWVSDGYPLSHRPDRYRLSLVDSDYFGVIVPLNTCVGSMVLQYRFKGQYTVRQMSTSIGLPCNAVISNLSATQVSGTQNVSIAWTGTGDVTGYLYRIDGGLWIGAASSPVVVNSVAIGAHTVDVRGICECSEGVAASFAFTVVNPSTTSCSSVVTGLTATQTSQGEVTISFSSSGPAPEWARILDGQRASYVNATTFQQTGLNLGQHTIRITPVCTNGFSGTGQEITFTVVGVPSITKVDESAAGPGSVRTQVFAIGSAVYAGNRYVMRLYLHEVTVTAVSGDTANSIAGKIRDAINATSTGSWNSAGAAPPVGTPGFPPTATATGNQVSITLNWQNGFAYQAYIS